MKTFDGYKKRALSNDNVLLAGGGHKSITDLLNPLKEYVLKSGDTITGTLTITKYGPTIHNYVSGAWAFQRYTAYDSTHNNMYDIGTYYTRDTFEIRRNGSDTWAFSPNTFYGFANNTYYLGTSSYRWANIYSTLGNFSSTVTAGKFHSNASASTDLTVIPPDTAIALETGNGNGSVNAWIWRENYSASNWGIFHNNSEDDSINFVGNNRIRVKISLSSNSLKVGGTEVSLEGHTHDSRYLRKDTNDSTPYQYSFTKTNDHAIQVGTIRGREVGSRSGQYIHLYERVHIGYPGGWGGREAPSYGLSTYGGAWLATDTGNVGIGTTSPAYKFHVLGSAYIAGQTWLNSTIYVIDSPSIATLQSSYGLPSNYTSNYNTENFLKAWVKYAYDRAPGRTVIGNISPSSRGMIQADVYASGINSSSGLPEHVTGRYYPHGGNEIIFGTSYGTWYYSIGIDSRNITNYYWANVKISNQSSTTTSPTFGYPTSIYSQFTNGSEIIGYIGRGGNDNNLYFGSYKNANINIFTDNTLSTCIYLKTGGNVGIGTTSPLYKLHLEGSGIYAKTSNTCGIMMESTHSESSISYKSKGGTRTVLGTYNNKFFLWNESIGEHITVLSANGNLGIGTAVPETKLDVNGIQQIYQRGVDNTAFKNLLLLKAQNSTETSGDNWGESYPTFGIGFRRYWTSGSSPYGETTCAGIYATISSSWRGGLVFRTKNNTTSGGTHDITALRLSPSGAATFANSITSGNITSSGCIRSTYYGPGFALDVAAGSWAYMRYTSGSYEWHIGENSSGGYIGSGGAFEIRSLGASYSGLSVRYNTSSYGKVVVSVPSGECSIGYYSNGAVRWTVGCSDGSNFGWYLGVGGGWKMTLDTSGNLTSVGLFYANSDIRYKSIQTHLLNKVNLIAELPIFTYYWNDDKHDNKLHIGSSAQAVKEVFPELVIYDESKDFYNLDYGVLGTVAGITACKELVTLKSEIDLLKERIELLEQQLKMINDYGRY